MALTGSEDARGWRELSGLVLQAIQQYAEAFAQYTEGTAVADIETLFWQQGKIGSGLNALLQKSCAMGKLFGKPSHCQLSCSDITPSWRSGDVSDGLNAMENGDRLPAAFSILRSAQLTNKYDVMQVQSTT